MKYSVSELAALCQCSVRTLHYYDEIGLLHPSATTAAGYRMYDEDAKARLMQILFYRELELPLREIKNAIDGPKEERRAALCAHRELLLLRRARLEELLRTLDESLEEQHMSKPKITAADIDNAKKKYADETRVRWGDTEEYRQSEEKAAKRGDTQKEAMAQDMAEIFSAFASAMDGDPAGETAQALVARWQAHITRFYYNCTKEILAGLGEMYTADERFTSNIDRYGDGTAAFMRDAIRVYCKK